MNLGINVFDDDNKLPRPWGSEAAPNQDIQSYGEQTFIDFKLFKNLALKYFSNPVQLYASQQQHLIKMHEQNSTITLRE